MFLIQLSRTCILSPPPPPIPTKGPLSSVEHQQSPLNFNQYQALTKAGKRSKEKNRGESLRTLSLISQSLPSVNYFILFFEGKRIPSYSFQLSLYYQQIFFKWLIIPWKPIHLLIITIAMSVKGLFFTEPRTMKRIGLSPILKDKSKLSLFHLQGFHKPPQSGAMVTWAYQGGEGGTEWERKGKIRSPRNLIHQSCSFGGPKQKPLLSELAPVKVSGVNTSSLSHLIKHLKSIFIHQDPDSRFIPLFPPHENSLVGLPQEHPRSSATSLSRMSETRQVPLFLWELLPPASGGFSPLFWNKRDLFSIRGNRASPRKKLKTHQSIRAHFFQVFTLWSPCKRPPPALPDVDFTSFLCSGLLPI